LLNEQHGKRKWGQLEKDNALFSARPMPFLMGGPERLKKRPEFMSCFIEFLKGFMQAIGLLSAFWWR